MQSLPLVGRGMRVLMTAVVVAVEIGLASSGLPCVVHAQDAADVRATHVAPLADNDALADIVLARQRGGRSDITAAGMPEIAAGAPSVMLWDELARPAPAPRPVGTTGATQLFNAIIYTRR
jgi:hypothetical protein